MATIMPAMKASAQAVSQRASITSSSASPRGVPCSQTDSTPASEPATADAKKPRPRM